jgi:hypothetical protein
VVALPCVVALLVLAGYAALVPAGRWQGDEYLISWFVAKDGLPFLLDRILGWGPWPVAESLRFGYFVVSNALHHPLVGPFLGAMWLASLLGIALAGWAGQVRRPLVLAVLVFALTLLLAKPGEMFYWPMATAAYLPCWAGLAAATILHRAAKGPHAIALTLALLAVAFSMEVGAATVLIYAGLMVAALLGDHTLLRRFIPLALPALGAVLVAVVLLSHRMQANEVMDATSGLAGNWSASLRAAVPAFAHEALGIAGMPLLAGLAIKLLLLVSLPSAHAGSRRDNRLGAMWTLALLLGAFASVAAAYHQFGTLCCERHATLRQGMILLALLTLAGLLGSALVMQRAVLLAVLLLTLLVVRAGPLYSDWQLRDQVFAARQRTWDSGAGPGDAMTLFLAPAGRILNEDALPPGQYHRTSDVPVEGAPWYAWGIMALFGKHTLTITTAGE